MAGGVPRQGVVGDFVVAVASANQQGLGELHQVGGQVAIGQLQLTALQAAGEHGARLNR